MSNIHSVVAKSADKAGKYRTLVEHIQDGLLVAKLLKSSFSTINKILDNEFWDILELCIIFHDLGKTHPEFQKLLKGQSNKWNKHRHELFSYPFISGLNIDKSLNNFISLVVLGHHKDFNTLSKVLDSYYPGNEFEEFGFINSNSFESDFKDFMDLNLVKKILKYFNIILSPLIVNDPQEPVNNYIRNSITINDNTYIKLLLLFGAFKHCDHMASALIDNIPILIGNDLQFLLKKRDELNSKKLDFYQHQLDSSKIIGSAVLISPTGSGKTETSLLWLKNQLDTGNIGRVFYILPFTASINAMFERLRFDFGEQHKDKIGMLHGALSSYLNEFLSDFQYSSYEKIESIKQLKEKFKTLLTPLKILTPFQLLKHLFGVRGFEKGIFEWTGGYFIFDEIHAYDPGVFAQIVILLEFVTKKLSAKVFIMTATLPSFLKEKLLNAMDCKNQITANDKLYDSFKRHKVVLIDGLLSENYDKIINDLKNGKHVLVVCNTVKQSQETYEAIKNYSESSILLHGGFNGFDRSFHEKRLMDRTNKQIQLLVGTQAIEISLDIDYDVIYTEPAPLDALLQRFGRVNRKKSKGISSCNIFKNSNSSDKYIYNTEVVDRTLNSINKIIQLDNSIILENKLQKYIDFVYPNWDEKLQDEYDITYKSLNYSIQNLSPLIIKEKNEDKFYEQFDGVTVLPISLEENFLKYLNNKDFISAESLKVKIRKNNFSKWVKDGSILKSVYYVEVKDKKLEIIYYILNRKYTQTLGLQKEKLDEINNNFF